MRFLSLCSGIEAASVAWEPLGWRAVAYSEIEPFACAVLKARHPGVPNLGDMTKIKGEEYRGAVDLIVGGTPCQDFSVAGKRAGLAGERGGLALHYLHLVDYVSPRWVIWENVPGVLSSNGGRDFALFISTLGKLGYGWAYRVLDAQYFGVPQRRRRIILVGYFGDWRLAAAALFEPHCLCGNSAPRRKAAENVAGTITTSAGRSGGKGTDLSRITQALTGRMGGGGPDDNKAQGGFYVPQPYETANTLTRRMFKGVNSRLDEGQTPVVCASLTSRPWADHESQETRLVSLRRRVRRLTPRECERLQGFPDDYTAIVYRGKPAADMPRYKALGNSMAVPVMRWIGERIALVEAQRKARQVRPGSGICR